MSEVLLERDAGVARITLNRPDAGNAFNQRMAEALRSAGAEVDFVPVPGAGHNDLLDFPMYLETVDAFVGGIAAGR